MSLVKWIGLPSGPLAALLAYHLVPERLLDPATGATLEVSAAARATVAVLVWMAIWWLTEAVEIEATSLLPLAVFPLLGIRSIREAAAPYASDVIFLFLGSFILAAALQRWSLDRRIALLTLRLVGTRPDRMVAGLMLATAAMSGFVSNTATAAMMLPIALSLTDVATSRSGTSLAPEETARFSRSALLGIAYAASIGGMVTLVGTPPNLFLAGFARDAWDIDLSFVRWLGVGLPLGVIMLPAVWLLLTRVLFPISTLDLGLDAAGLRRRYEELGPPGRGEIATFLVFILTAGAWLTRPFLPVPGLSDAGIAMIAAVVLFVIPVDPKRRVFVMEWQTARKLPWGVLLLFGGGLSLALAVEANGVDRLIATRAALLANWPAVATVAAVTAATVFLTELTTNTATAATLVPILAAAAPGLGIDPLVLVTAVALSASCAFMLPVATPPNAIVFGSGHIRMPDMMRAGIWLNLLSIIVITILAFTAVPWALGR
ncbi:MAG TPA: DASS family sodium-coupled anion symporter [Thermoanaerobaculia bacterium]|nr:DASS family sodium-coupled anion symporter [Thermoanaerobaculia bacterium]